MTKKEHERFLNEIVRKGLIRVQAALIITGLGVFLLMAILDRLTGISMLILGMLMGLGVCLPLFVKFPPKKN